MNPSTASFFDFIGQALLALISGIPLGFLSPSGLLFKAGVAISAVICVVLLVICVKLYRQGKRFFAHALFILFFFFWYATNFIGYLSYTAPDHAPPFSTLFFPDLCKMLFFLILGSLLNFLFFFSELFSVFSNGSTQLDTSFLFIGFSFFALVSAFVAIRTLRNSNMLFRYLTLACALFLWSTCGVMVLGISS